MTNDTEDVATMVARRDAIDSLGQAYTAEDGVIEPIPFPAEAWPLLRKALEHIAAHPDELYMGSWIVTMRDTDAHGEVAANTGLPFPACGTAACLGGHINLMAGVPEVDIWEMFSVGRNALDLLGIERGTPEAYRMECVFEAVQVKTYDELCDVLGAYFTFPEPFPQAPDALAGRV